MKETKKTMSETVKTWRDFKMQGVALIASNTVISKMFPLAQPKREAKKCYKSNGKNFTINFIWPFFWFEKTRDKQKLEACLLHFRFLLTFISVLCECKKSTTENATWKIVAFEIIPLVWCFIVIIGRNCQLPKKTLPEIFRRNN